MANDGASMFQDPAAHLPEAVFARLMRDVRSPGTLRLPSVPGVPPEVLVRYVWRRWLAWSGDYVPLWQVPVAEDPGVAPGDWLHAPGEVGCAARRVVVDPEEVLAVEPLTAALLASADARHAVLTDPTLGDASARLRTEAEAGGITRVEGCVETAEALVRQIHLELRSPAEIADAPDRFRPSLWVLLPSDRPVPTRPQASPPGVRRDPRPRPPHPAFAEILGEDPALVEVLELAAQVAKGTAPILITGDTGVGKDGLARALHTASGRGLPFEAVNLAEANPELLASELFGYEQGAFPGATRRTEGIFVRAGGGTVFLDEVGELPLKVQGTLLRVLQERTVRRLGAGGRLVPVHCGIVLATNRSLSVEVVNGRFRHDLMARMGEVVLRLPTLADRRGDVLPLFRHFYAEVAGRPPRLTPAAEAALLGHPWPENVRGVRNVARAAAVVTERALYVEPEHLGEVGRPPGPWFVLGATPQEAQVRIPPLSQRPAAVAHHLRVATAGHFVEPDAWAWLLQRSWAAPAQLRDGFPGMREPRWSLPYVQARVRPLPGELDPGAGERGPPSAGRGPPAPPARPGPVERLRVPTPPAAPGPSSDLAWLAGALTSRAPDGFSRSLAAAVRSPGAPSRFAAWSAPGRGVPELKALLGSPEGPGLVRLVHEHVGDAAWEAFLRDLPPILRPSFSLPRSRAGGSPGSA